MKKIHLLQILIACFLASSNIQAQSPGFEWARRIGGMVTYNTYHSITTDFVGNVYNVGYFEDTADFDPGTAVLNISSNGGEDIFIQKFDSAGTLLWVKQIGGTGNDKAKSVITDNDGNIYVTGYFTGTVDFDPGSGLFNASSIAGRDMFILKMDSNGNFIWVKHIGNASVHSITIDTKGNLYSTGGFTGNVDFDPGPGVHILNNTIWSTDAFILKMDTTGNMIWVAQITGQESNAGASIATDTSGNVHVLGTFKGTTDFDPDTGSINRSSNGYSDVFIQKLDSNGKLIWIKTFGGLEDDKARTIVVDDKGNVYTNGLFYGTVDFDPGFGVKNIVSIGHYDIFIQKLNRYGNLKWAKQIGGNNPDDSHPIAIDDMGNLYVTGFFWGKNNSGVGTFDVDPGAGTLYLNSNGLFDFFINKLDVAGKLVWSKQIGGIGSDEIFSISLDDFGNLYATGIFQDSVDFDFGAGVSNLHAVKNIDSYIFKMNVESLVTDLKSNESRTANFVVCPNPTNGKFSIEFENNISKAEVSIFSINGKLIKRSNQSNFNSIEVDIENERSGFYLVEVKSLEGNQTIRIVKN